MFSSFRTAPLLCIIQSVLFYLESDIYIHVGVIYVIPVVLIRIAPKGSLIFRGENCNLSERSENIIKIHYDVALGK